jgi:chromosome segregation ATPase
VVKIIIEKLLKKILDTVGEIKNEQQEMKNEQQGMKNQLEENTVILRALEHKADVHKAELDKLTNEVATISGIQKKMQNDIEEIKHDVNILAINTAKNSLDIAKIKGIK